MLPGAGLAQDPAQPNETTPSTQAQSEAPGDAAADAASTPPEPAMDAYIEEIVVEGTRAQGIKEVPISVTQFGASDIENLRIQNVADLSAYTPNLEINTSFAASNPTLFIRGVGLKDYNSNSTGAVAIWHDGIMMNSPTAQLFSIFDIESIEVLRGPIGGLRGRNATAGAIRLNSFKPSTDWSASGNFTYGNLNEIMFEGALGFPIFPEATKETLSARVAFITEFRDPYTENVCSGWNPEEFGLLTSTQDATEDFYADLDASATQVETSLGNTDTPTSVQDRYIYQDFAAVQQYNDSENQVAINIARLLDGPGGTPGTLVGLQRNQFGINPDNVCLLETAGNLTTAAGATSRRPEGSFRANTSAAPLSDFEDLNGKYNDIKYWGGRAQVLWQPTETMDFLGKFHFGQNRGDSFHLQSIGVAPGQASTTEVITEPLGFTEALNSASWSEIRGDFAPFEGRRERKGLRPQAGSEAPPGARGQAGDDPFSGFYSSDGSEDLDLYGASATGNFEFEWGRIEAVSGYEYSSRTIDDEGDGCPCTPLAADIDDDVWQVTQEITATYEGDGYSARLGAFYIHEDLESGNFFKSSIRASFDQKYEQTTDSAYVGAEFHYDFFEEDAAPGLWQVSFDGGVRYNVEHKDFTLGTDFILEQTGGIKESIPKENISDTWDAATGEATLSYKPVENARLYVKYTHGFKAGHFNAGITEDPATGGDEPVQDLDPVEPEYVDALELGLKSSWFDDRVELSGAFFRYWYEDMQVFDIVNESGQIATQQLLNANAHVLGAEMELTLRPIDGVLVQGSVGWLDTEYGDFPVSKVTVPATGQPPRPGLTSKFNYKGNKLIAAPEWSASGYAEWELPLSRFGTLVPSANFSYKSRSYHDVQQETLLSQEPYWLFDSRLSYRTPDGSIEIAGWVENFLDEKYRIDSFDESRQYGHILEIWGEPRTYGFTIYYYLSAE